MINGSEHFLDLLPRSLNAFVMMYDNPQPNIESLCDRFTRYKICLKVINIHYGKMAGSLGSATAFHSQSVSSTKDKGKGKGKGKQRDLTDVMLQMWQEGPPQMQVP